MNSKITRFFIVLFLFILAGLFPVANIYCNSSDNGLNSEERTSISNFTEQTKKSIETANLLIKNKQLNKANGELENLLNSVNKKISEYENKAQALVSENKKNSAKIYYREASSLGKTAVKISQSIKEIAALQEEYENRRPQEESANYVTQGFEYLKSGNLDKAESSFNKALVLLPENRKAKDGLARVERERGRIKAERISELLEEARNNIKVEAFDEAEEKLQEVLTLEPDNRKVQTYWEDMQKLKQAKEYKDLLVDVDQKIEEGENNLRMGKFEEAETNLNEALKVLPSGEKNRTKKIESLLTSIPELKQKEQAGANLQRIGNIVAEAKQQIEENKLGELIKQGKGYLSNNNFEEAKRKFSEALQIRPGNELVLQYLAETEQAKKDYESRRVIEGLITEGKRYLEAEQLDKADGIFRKALNRASSKDEQIRIQSLLSDVDKARQTIYNRKLQQQADVYIAYGIDNLNKSQYAKARTNFEKALAIKPDYSETQQWLIRLQKAQEEDSQYKLQTMMMEGKEYLKDNKFDLAKSKFEGILEIDHTYPEALHYLDMVEKTKVEYKNKQQFQKVESVINSGIKYLEEGQFSKAESVFKEALDMASPQLKEEVVKIIEEKVNAFIYEDESQKRADKCISSGIAYLNNNEFDKAEESFKTALNIIPGYPRGEECLQKLEIAKLKYQSSQSLGIDGIIMETAEKRESELENNVNQLLEQIKGKIEESEKILGKGRIE